MNMRTWKEKLFLDAMPGRKKLGRPQGDFSSWLREMQANRIHTVVCLAPEEQIAGENPEYAQWRCAQLGEPAETASTTAGAPSAAPAGQFELIDIPVDDFQAPDPFVAARFWNAARRIADRIDNGERVFIHCGAGIGRTGMFAVAVLVQQGYDYDEAYREINAVGSYPEVPAQREFLQRTPTRRE
jgi:predicted protein tyrosine phosphatase